MSISSPFIRRPIATSLLTAAIFLAGLVAFPLLPVAPLPNVEFPTLTVTANYPGASPATMASTVATPLETEFGQMLPGLSQMTSVSVQGSTQITLQFGLGVDLGNAETLVFPDRAFDAYTIAFGIRNVPRIELALGEAFRVLKPGGRFLCLEFSTVDVPGLDRIYDLFSFRVIPPLGRAVTGDAEAYRYLVESIRKFPRPNAFAEMIRNAGFSRVSWQRLSGGIVALHSGWRL